MQWYEGSIKKCRSWCGICSLDDKPLLPPFSIGLALKDWGDQRAQKTDGWLLHTQALERWV